MTRELLAEMITGLRAASSTRTFTPTEVSDMLLDIWSALDRDAAVASETVLASA